MGNDVLSNNIFIVGVEMSQDSKKPSVVLLNFLIIEDTSQTKSTIYALNIFK